MNSRAWGTLAGVVVPAAVALLLWVIAAPRAELLSVGGGRGVRLADAGADQLVLGCTHYPFLAGSVRAEFGDTFALVDSGAAVARHTRNVLTQAGLLRGEDHVGEVAYLTTGDPDDLRPLLTTLLPQNGQTEAAGATPTPSPVPRIAPAPRIESTTT